MNKKSEVDRIIKKIIRFFWKSIKIKWYYYKIFNPNYRLNLIQLSLNIMIIIIFSVLFLGDFLIFLKFLLLIIILMGVNSVYSLFY